VTADLETFEGAQNAIDSALERFGRIDVLINNVGGTIWAKPYEHYTPQQIQAEVARSLFPTLWTCRAVLPHLIEQASGTIVNVSSVSALRPSPGTAAYGAAKAGLDSLTRSLAVEWAPRVRVNGIDVGMVRTEQTDDHYGGDDGVARIEATIPLGRMADPADVGRLVAFLASDLAAYVSGSTIECHGGGEAPAFLAAAQDSQEETP